MTDYKPKQQRKIGHEIAYWGLLLGAYLVFLPNMMGLKGADGNPWFLWLLSPFLGFAATGVAVWDKSLPRIVIALFFGVGAINVLFFTVLLTGGP